MIQVLCDFFPVLLSGFLVNLQIACGAVIIGLLIGLPMALLRYSIPWTGRFIRPCVRLMQAAPVYVVMFFVLNILPRDMIVLGFSITGLAAVTLSQSVYLTSYIAENGYQAIEQLVRHERDNALLFLPNLLRGFLVVVMSSGIGAAIGVSEAVSVTMHQAEQLHALWDRVLLFLVVIGLFAAVFGLMNALLQRLIRRMLIHSSIAAQRNASVGLKRS